MTEDRSERPDTGQRRLLGRTILGTGPTRTPEVASPDEVASLEAPPAAGPSVGGPYDDERPVVARAPLESTAGGGPYDDEELAPAPPVPQGRLGRAAAIMAAGTVVSRVTGLLRVIALAYALGPTPSADAYNLANTTPNMLYDIVLGGVLSATFIPIFVERLAKRSEREAWRAISAVVTMSAVVVVAMTAVFWVLAPQVISAYTAFAHVTARKGATHAAFLAEKALAVTLLRWFVPQIAIYGLIALVTALLNTRRRFAAPMWVPIANNAVVIGVLVWFHHLVPHLSTLTAVHLNGNDILVLGLGTTAGVALQALALLPALRGAGLSKLRWHWDPRHEAVRTVLRLGGWTFGFVVANQVALYVVLALAVRTPGRAPVSAYTYAYTFMQMPYAVVAVSVMSAVAPELAERWTAGDIDQFRRRLATGLRATLAVIVPASVGTLVLAKPAVGVLLAHGSTTYAGTETTGAALALFSIGLPGFCAYLYVIRVLQSMQRTKIAFFLYLAENGLNIILALALVNRMGVRGLALALSIAYTVSALIGVLMLRRWLGTLGGARVWSPLRRVALATAAMAVVVIFISNLSGAEHGLGLYGRVVASVVVGAATYAGVAILLGGRRRPLAAIGGFERSELGDRSELGSGGGLGGMAWGDTRVPVNTGPRIRILPAAGADDDAGPRRLTGRAGTAGGPQSARQVQDPPGPGGGSRRRRTVAPPPGAPRPARTPGRSAPSAPPTPAAPRQRPVRLQPPVPEPVKVTRSAAPAEIRENSDDPGERRWLGGTSARPEPPRPRRRPR